MVDSSKRRDCNIIKFPEKGDVYQESEYTDEEIRALTDLYEVFILREKDNPPSSA